MYLAHVVINVGMVVGLMPVTGIPLPFISYGGVRADQLDRLSLLVNVYAKPNETELQVERH